MSKTNRDQVRNGHSSEDDDEFEQTRKSTKRKRVKKNRRSVDKNLKDMVRYETYEDYDDDLYDELLVDDDH